MQRQQGTFPFSANFEVKVAGTFDARQYCSEYAQLAEYTADDYLVPGFPVAVWDADPERRGIYQLESLEPLTWKKINDGPENLASILAAKADLVDGKIPAAQLPALGITRTYTDIADRDADVSLSGVTFGLVVDASDDPEVAEGSALYVITDSGWVLFDVEGVQIDGIRNAEPIVSDINVPNSDWVAGDALPPGSTWIDGFNKLLKKTFYPTLIAPSFSMSHGGFSFKKIGEAIDLSLSLNFDPGKILGAISGSAWSPGAVQGNRSGSATSYIFENLATQATGSLIVSNYSVLAGYNTFQGAIVYGVGPQPKDSKNINFDSVYPAGTSPEQSTSFEGVYPFFADETELPLMSNLNAGSFEATLMSEADTDLKQSISFPKRVVDNGRTVTKIEYFNPVANVFDPANQLSDFTLTSVTKVVSSQEVDYKKLTYHGSKRGALKVRVYYS